ncbi:MAG: branched-chain amino acid transport system II carrier protein [Alphaproteobacteria bacterium]|nr:branched-chain amino acid transport system II carrier protein [Alphaproteobacteria bacterium]
MFFNRITITAGFALFSMFFGSGNLIFPLSVGRYALDHYMYAIAGLFLTAVLVPIMGFVGTVFDQGDRHLYFKPLGKKLTFILTLLMLVLLGPFGVIPRCISVSYGGMVGAYPTLDLWHFSLIFCALTGALIWRPNKVVSIIGVFITPFKLSGIFFLIVVGIYYAPETMIGNNPAGQVFTHAFVQGYQTMDLLAAFFFGCTIVSYIHNQIKNTEHRFHLLVRHSFYAGIIGLSLLALAYTGFVVLGASYALHLKDIAPESLLVTISGVALGPIAIPIVAYTIFISCLSTATILAKLFAEFLHKDICKQSISYTHSVILTMIIAFAMSLLGFQTIVNFLAFFLSWLYPLLIIYALYKIVQGIRQYQRVKD